MIIILSVVSFLGACHAMSKGAVVKFTFLIRQDNVIIQKVSILMKYAMPGKKLYSSLENSWVFQNLDLYKEKFKQLRGQAMMVSPIRLLHAPKDAQTHLDNCVDSFDVNFSLYINLRSAT
ncbi:uncharacterized protein LOC112033623 [Quercus suber]|uniref:uncharacterized protein LOC112033623 n=1 Tax=Quercus suber TaxID=58331 RepID=UPI0032DFA631